GSNKGESTDFNKSSYEDLQNLSDIVLENTNYGKIQFNEAINVTNDLNVSDNKAYLDTYTNISSNHIEVNSTALPNFNKSATLYLYNLSLGNPRILRDSSVCPDNICTEIDYSGGTLIFNVTYFTVYSAEETPSGSVSPGDGRASEPTGGYECETNSKCKRDEICWKNRCVKLFDVKIIDFESPAKLGAFFAFTYFIKGMADINEDVEVTFWIDREGEIVTSGSDVIYLGSFEEKTEETKIFLPTNIKSGIYEFYVEVVHQAYTAQSHRTIEVEVEGDLITIIPRETQGIKSYIIAFLIILIVIILSLIISLERKKIKSGLINETKWFRKHRKSIIMGTLILTIGLILYLTEFFDFLAIKLYEVVLWFKMNVPYTIYATLALGLIIFLVIVFKNKKIRDNFYEWGRKKRVKRSLNKRSKENTKIAKKGLKHPKKIRYKKIRKRVPREFFSNKKLREKMERESIRIIEKGHLSIKERNKKLRRIYEEALKKQEEK
ncbi:MAG TPA: hypothetical protein VMV95_02720, partial [Bacillota bacterium]|nr:hypothetical protein [Bacillota bacterium]